MAPRHATGGADGDKPCPRALGFIASAVAEAMLIFSLLYLLVFVNLFIPRAFTVAPPHANVV